ncbi:uncharacterized protein GGS22DRAFT_187690 [Annulohypoxylon maeteangense]|uniref:uncharacterized protein n=1 Tax=Annulohypoxylon maeteangense TaxID=1927788 RepID=UPI002007DC60|nr:uncharacterized protein GGS22DRAFT_187690 [Annulohypoxylon maeteangense]KAI0886445.1 hypothetical protein GGS22DRAFT_187690 [Annulohypoxylon maeteangense]
MSTSTADVPPSITSFETIGIKNKRVNEAPGVKLSPDHKLLVGSVLDLFEGNPTLKHLSLWSQDATFADPITVASGYKKFAAQWYGLPALFNPIQIQSHLVTSTGNPIQMELSNKYTLKGIGTAQIINSVVHIDVGQNGKIERVEDRWNDRLPNGMISDAFRKLNAQTVPMFVTIPKDEEEDLKLKNSRDGSS